MHRLAALLVVILLTSCTTVPTAKEAAVMDVATTSYGLAHGARELNPIGFAGSTVLKLVLLVKMDNMAAEERADISRIVSSLWTGAAVNNIIQIIWAPSMGISVLAGAIVARDIYVRSPEVQSAER
jgi:hypothetical protein